MCQAPVASAPATGQVIELVGSVSTAEVEAQRSKPHAAAASCPRCVGAGRTCPSCVQRRRYAWSLVIEQGATPEAAAGVLGLSATLVERLIEEECDRRELRSLRCESIPVQLTRSVIEDALRRDSDLTIGDIAHWLDMHQVDFERAFLGRPKSGQPKRRVNVSSASRLMIALGRAPNELPGC